eukprot:6918807-Lingulodinium_polyedra.AAC.1
MFCCARPSTVPIGACGSCPVTCAVVPLQFSAMPRGPMRRRINPRPVSCVSWPRRTVSRRRAAPS